MPGTVQMFELIRRTLQMYGGAIGQTQKTKKY